MEEGAVPVVALLVAKEGRAIFGGSVLRSQDPIAISRSVHGTNACRCVGFARERHINPDSLVGVTAGLSLADHDLFDLAVLTEIFPSTQRLEELVFIADRRVQANNVDQILLDNTNTSQILATRGFNLPSLRFLLLCRGCLAVFQCQICFEPSWRRVLAGL